MAPSVSEIRDTWHAEAPIGLQPDGVRMAERVLAPRLQRGDLLGQLA